MARDHGITQWHGKRVFTLATKANVRAMKTAALLLEADVKKHFTLQGKGRLYRRKRKGGKGYILHRASKPGQPPAIDTGILRASIMSEVTTRGPTVTGRVGPDVEYIAAKADVGTDVNYGLDLELGKGTMKARPFLRPALKRMRRKINAIFRKANS